MFDFNRDGKVDAKEMLTGMFIMDQIDKNGGGSGGGNNGNNGGCGCLVAIILMLIFLVLARACIS